MPDDATQPDDDIEQLRALARRVGAEPVAWETPPADLWERIAADVDDPVGDGRTIGDADEPLGPADRAGAPAVTPLAAAARGPRRNRTAALPWLAAAAVLVVIVGAVAWLGGADDPAVVAQTDLELLGEAGEGSAELVERDGTFRLSVSTSGIDIGDDAFAEVWMINPDVTAMISLGPLQPDGTYDLPAGLDPSTFPIVDISIEPLNGDPTHSGNSVLRGQLSF